MNRFLTLVNGTALFLSLTTFPALSQETLPCGTAALMESAGVTDFYDLVDAQMQNKVPQKKDRSTLTIPVVFHIIYNTPDQNISDAFIFEQMDRLNEDFQRMNADTVNTPLAFRPLAGAMDIEFCLAKSDPSGEPSTGIVRTSTDELSFSTPASYDIPDPVKHSSTGGHDAWNTEEYLNIWICNLVGSTAYTAPPGNFIDPVDDGIVCHFNHVGNSGIIPFDLGRSIVHEVGHWLGLKHIWGDDGGTCSGTDFIADTPNQTNWTGGCPDFPLYDACTPTEAGVMFMNYMDYSHDGCRNMFSAGQVAYMELFYETLMPEYYTVDHCTPLDLGVENQINDFKLALTDHVFQIESGEMISDIACYNMNGQLLTVYPINSTAGTFQVAHTGFIVFEIRYHSDRQPGHVKWMIH